MASVRSIVGLILNIIILPGLGTLVGGRIKQGAIQLILYIIGVILLYSGVFAAAANPMLLILTVIGVILAIAMWIWGLVSGIQMVMESGKRR